MHMIKVSCVIPTFNRYPDYVHLLDESVESFLRQDIKSKELIIFNDTPNQEIKINHPDILVVNSPRRYRNLGEKLNAAFGLARGEYLCRFDDDDCSLPWRLSYSISRMEELNTNYYRPRRTWFKNGNNIRRDGNSYNTGPMWTREVFDKVGGFRHMGSGQDVEYETDVKKYNLAQKNQLPVCYDEPDEKLFYIYRWGHGTGPAHLSGFGRGIEGYNKIGERPIKEGVYEINPKWEMDYINETKRLWQNDQNV